MKLLHFEIKNRFFPSVDVSFLFLLLFLAFLPINQKISTLLIVVNVVISLLNIKFFDIEIFKKYSLLVVLYFLYAAAYYRDEFKFGINLFEQKASLIAFSLILSTQRINKQKLETLLKVLVLSCILAYSFFLVRALFYSFDFNQFSFNTKVVENREVFKQFEAYRPLQTNYFLGRIFSAPIQSPLIALFFSFAIGVLINKKHLFKKQIRYIFISILSIAIFQIFSIIGIISWLFVVLVNYYHNKKVVFSIVFMFLISLVFLNTYNGSHLETLKKLDDRVVIWNTAPKTISKSVLAGHGYKTAQRKLEKDYPKRGDFGATSQEKKLDAHNTYLQITLEWGLIGLCILILILIKFYKNIKSIAIGKVFFVLVLLYSMTESILNIYGGLSLFTFFYCLFCNHTHVIKDEDN